MKKNNAFKKVVSTAIALAAFAMVGTSAPALVYAEETGAIVEEAAENEVVCGGEETTEEVAPSNEEAPDKTPVKSRSFWDDPSGALHRAYLWQKNHNYKTTETSPMATPDETLVGTPAETPTGTPAETRAEAQPEETSDHSGAASEATVKSAHENQMDALTREIVAANAEAQQAGVVKTVYRSDVTTVTLPVMKTLRACPNVVLDMTYTYEGVAYHSAVAGGATVVYDETIPCYGPLWLFANYGVK